MSRGARDLKSYTPSMAAPGIGARLVALPLAWLMGVALQLQERSLWPLSAYVAIAVTAAVALALVGWARRAFLIALAAALAAGFAAAGWQASLRAAEALPTALEGRDIIVTGSIRLCHALIPAGLVDEYRFFVYPVVQGRGRRLFPDGHVVPRLRLVEARAFGGGITLLRYARAR